MTGAKLSIDGLGIAFGPRTVVDLERLELGSGEILGLAGESGSGKSITALAVLGLASTLGARVEGSIRLDDEELVGAPERHQREIRGSRVAMIFQSPVSSLDPLLRVGELFERALRLHGVGKREASERAAGAFREVLLSPDLLERYPHELSGGQAQRIAIALALALRSEVLLADEPTSALDVTTQLQILRLLRDLAATFGVSMLFVTHDFGVVAQLCDAVMVMYAGQSVEAGPTAEVLERPRHPYTQLLIACHPDRSRELAGIPGVSLAADSADFAKRVEAAVGREVDKARVSAFVADNDWTARIRDVVRLCGVPPR